MSLQLFLGHGVDGHAINQDLCSPTSCFLGSPLPLPLFSFLLGRLMKNSTNLLSDILMDIERDHPINEDEWQNVCTLVQYLKKGDYVQFLAKYLILFLSTIIVTCVFLKHIEELKYVYINKM